MLVTSRLYPDHVGIWTRTVPIVGAQPVVIERIRGQARDVSTSRVADVQVLVPRCVVGKRTVRGHI